MLNNPLVRIALVAVGAFTLYRLVPVIMAKLPQEIVNPNFYQNRVLQPLQNLFSVDKLKVNTGSEEVLSATDSNENSNNISPQQSTQVQVIVNQVKEQVSTTTKEGIDVIKKTANEQFCKALIEKIEKECYPDH